MQTTRHLSMGSSLILLSAITTYGKRGVTKPGCNAADHSVVYLQGKQPVMYKEEVERGLVKDSIMIEPTEANEEMDPGSRLRYGKMYAIEWNIKFRDIGMVSAHDRTKLMKYFKESQNSGFDSDNEELEEAESDSQYSTPQTSHQQAAPPSSYEQDEMPLYPQSSQQYPQSNQQYSRTSQQAQYPIQQPSYHQGPSYFTSRQIPRGYHPEYKRN
jgi:hypothetical protein